MPIEPRKVVSDPKRLARIRWRCRRGMLENDLILTRFLDDKGAALTEEQVTMLDKLLALTDNELWDLIAGRAEPADASVLPLLAELRDA
jgi:antitoxin CptB